MHKKRHRLVLFLLSALACPIAAGGAWAADPSAGVQLVPGGLDLSAPVVERQTELLSLGGLSLGTVAAPSANPSERLALGGYLAYAIDTYRLSTTLRNQDIGRSADLSAAYRGDVLGSIGVAALHLGMEWQDTPAIFSPNPDLSSFSVLAPYSKPGVSLSLSWSQDITPNLSLGGFAGASRSTVPQDDGQAYFRIGAGLGIKF